MLAIKNKAAIVNNVNNFEEFPNIQRPERKEETWEWKCFSEIVFLPF